MLDYLRHNKILQACGVHYHEFPSHQDRNNNKLDLGLGQVKDASNCARQSTHPSPALDLVLPANWFPENSPASSSTFRSSHNRSIYVLSIGPDAMTMFDTIAEQPQHNLGAFNKLRLVYRDGLVQQDLIQAFIKELHWPGKGPRVTFQSSKIPPLFTTTHLGASITANVEKDLCPRIALARKTMRCSYHWTMADALEKIHHLQNLLHRHIVQLVGTYHQGCKFSILMYLVVGSHSGEFLQNTTDSQMREYDVAANVEVLVGQKSFPSAMVGLTPALGYVHDNTTNHMDIESQNLLVRSLPERQLQYSICLAGFGLFRSFAGQGYSQTDEPTARTPCYCASEVYASERRGRASGIFSLGCIYVEIITMCYGEDLDKFAHHRRGDGDDESFHTSLDKVWTWLGKLRRNSNHFPIWLRLLNAKTASPELAGRPTASIMEHRFHSIADIVRSVVFKGRKECCDSGPEPYIAYGTGNMVPTEQQKIWYPEIKVNFCMDAHTTNV